MRSILRISFQVFSSFLLSSIFGCSTTTGLTSSTCNCKSSSTISGLISTPKDLIRPENASNFFVSSSDRDFVSTFLDCSWIFPLGLLFFSTLGVTFLGLMGVSSSFFSITFTTFCTDVRKLSSSLTCFFVVSLLFFSSNFASLEASSSSLNRLAMSCDCTRTTISLKVFID